MPPATIHAKISTHLGPQWASDSKQQDDKDLAERVKAAVLEITSRYFPNDQVEFEITRDYTSDRVYGTPAEKISQIGSVLFRMDFFGDVFDVKKEVAAIIGPQK